MDGYLTTKGDAVAATYRMIDEAGFEVEGNAESDGLPQADAGGFRLAGTDGEILKPDIARP